MYLNCYLKNIYDFIYKTLFLHHLNHLNLIFFKLLFACPKVNFGPLLRGQTHAPDVNHCVLHFRPEGHQEPCNEVGSLSSAEHLVGIEPETFQFLLLYWISSCSENLCSDLCVINMSEFTIILMIKRMLNVPMHIGFKEILIGDI